MISAWLDLPTVALFAVLILFYGSITALIVWLTAVSPLRAWIQSLSGVVAPFFAASSVLFALLTGFLASDVGDRNRQAWQSVNRESTAALTAYTLSIASTSDMTAIRTALRDYLQSVVKDEWRSMADNGASPKTDVAFAALLRQVSDPAIATSAGQSVHNALLGAVVRIGEARSVRLSLSSDRTNDVKWMLVLILGVITQVSLAVVHLERTRAQLTAIVLFSIAATVALGLIALQEQPFDGPLRIYPEPIETALKSMTN